MLVKKEESLLVKYTSEASDQSEQHYLATLEKIINSESTGKTNQEEILTQLENTYSLLKINQENQIEQLEVIETSSN
jgi:hypothetical protein